MNSMQFTGYKEKLLNRVALCAVLLLRAIFSRQPFDGFREEEELKRENNTVG